MVSTSLMLAAAAGAALFTAGSSAPRTFKYRIAQTTQQSIDASAAGQGEQKVNLGYIAFLTVTLNDSAGGRSVQAIIDSIGADSTGDANFVAPILTAKGATGAGFVDAAGKLTGFETADTAEAARMGTLRGLVASLFPRVRATAKAGDNWTDTTETADSTGVSPNTRKAVTSFKATAGPAKAIRFEMTGSYSIAGTAPNGGIFEGTGKNSGTFQRANEGHLIDGTFNDNADLSLTIPALTEPIPVAIVSTVSITLLK
jgi:hypothetical protein